MAASEKVVLAPSSSSSGPSSSSAPASSQPRVKMAKEGVKKVKPPRGAFLFYQEEMMNIRMLERESIARATQGKNLACMVHGSADFAAA